MQKPKRRLMRKGRGTVAVIVTLLVVSALVRLTPNAGAVLANATFADRATPAPEQVTGLEADVPSMIDVDAMLAMFQEREARIKEQEQEIIERMRILEVADRRVTEQIEALRMAERELRATMALASTAAEDDLARLTSVYENMKPKEAAAVFEEMAPEFAAGFLGRMRPDAAASVMAGMTPEAAYSVSAILAGRNANVPTE